MGKKIARILEKCGELELKKIAKKTGISRSDVKQLLKKMKHEGMIREIKVGNKRFYKIIRIQKTSSKNYYLRVGFAVMLILGALLYYIT